jgi:large subunit ribosomal protein L7/L12
VEPDAIWLAAAAVSFVMLCGIALWRNRASATADPHAPAPPTAHKLDRVRAYRKQHAVGLKEALLAVEAQDRGQPLAEPQAQPMAAADSNVEGLVQQGRVIEAIKLYREHTGASLADAKQAIDRLRATK